MMPRCWGLSLRNEDKLLILVYATWLIFFVTECLGFPINLVNMLYCVLEAKISQWPYPFQSPRHKTK